MLTDIISNKPNINENKKIALYLIDKCIEHNQIDNFNKIIDILLRLKIIEAPFYEY